MIGVAILIMTSVIFIIVLARNKRTYITLEEVIPEARILSQEEGIIEYKDMQFILGTHDLKKRKRLIKSLHLLNLDGPCIVDLRFNTQVIIKGGPSLGKHKSGPKDM